MLPIVILAVVFLALIMFNRRSRDRASRADATRRERLRPGTEVMTTSGLYATVLAVDTERDTALLSIAPGVEVTWAIAALREATELPAQYRGAVGPATPSAESHEAPQNGSDQANS